MEMMNTEFYNRMINSSKKLFTSEKSSKEPKSKSFLENKPISGQKTGSNRKPTYGKNKKRLPANRINKAKSSNTKTMKSMMSTSFERRNRLEHVVKDCRVKNPGIKIRKNKGNKLTPSRNHFSKNSQFITDSSTFNPVSTNKAKTRIKAVVVTKVNPAKCSPKKFKKEIASPNPPGKNYAQERNSLSKFFSSNLKTTRDLFEPKEKNISSNSSLMKISKIEYQVKRHCLQNKTLVASMGNPGKQLSTQPDCNDLVKSTLSKQTLTEERLTRNTSHTSTKQQNREFDSSFMYADIDLGDKKELVDEHRISDKINTRSTKTYASNFQKVLGKNKSYGCSCGRADDPRLNCCKRAEEWLKYAFNGSSKKFGQKDKKVFKELVETKVKKETCTDTENDDRIPITVCIENDLKRTFPHEEYYQSSEAKETLFNVLKAYTLYDNKCGYVQGMNFIAASLIYHSSPDIAFWLLVSLMFDYQLRHNYEAGLVGVEGINTEIQRLIDKRCPKLSKLFKETETDLGIFSLELIMSLFGIAIPLNETGAFYDNFFEKGWVFFSKLISVFLEDIQSILLREENPWEIIRIIKAHTSFANMQQYDDIEIKPIDWASLIRKAQDIK